MLRIRGTRDTLLTALVAEWSHQQIGLPAQHPTVGPLQRLLTRMPPGAEKVNVLG